MGELSADLPGAHRYVAPTMMAQAAYIYSSKFLRSQPAKQIASKIMFKRPAEGGYPPTPPRRRIDDNMDIGNHGLLFRQNMPVRTRGQYGRLRRMRLYARFRRRRTGGRKGKGVTAQYDRQQIYKRKPMPSYKRRKWVGFVRKVHAVVDNSLAPKNVLFQHSIVPANGTQPQWIATACLGGAKGFADGAAVANSNCGYGDLFRIFYNDPDIIKAAGPGVVLDNGKIMITNMTMDLTYFNNTTVEAPKRQEVDVYEIFGRNGDYPGLQEYYGIALGANTQPINGAAPLFNIASRGATPFDIPIASSMLRVVKKTKFFVEAGSTFTYQIRVPKNIFIDARTLNTVIDTVDAQFVGNCNYAGATRYLMFVIKNTDGTDVTVSDANKQFRIGTTRSYNYKVLKENIFRQNLISGSAAYP